MILNQITLPCLDYEASCAFYNTLGLVQIVSAPPHYARFEVSAGDGATLSLHLVDAKPPPGAIIYFDFDTPARLDATVRNLQTAGLNFHQDPKDMRWGWREARLRDPAGNEVCLMFAGSRRRFPAWRLDGRTA